MKFSAWELLALQRSLESAIDRGDVERLSGEALVKRLQNAKPKEK